MLLEAVLLESDQSCQLFGCGNCFAGRLPCPRLRVEIPSRSEGFRTQGAFIQVHSDSDRTPCGRRRFRARRIHRPCFQHRPSRGLRVSCLNCQSLSWDKVAHRAKLQLLAHTLRAQRCEVCFLTDVTVQSAAPQVVWIEEFCFIFWCKVAVVLRASLARIWERQGRQLFFEPQSERLLGVAVTLHGEAVIFVAMYSPPGQQPGPKREHYALAQRFALVDAGNGSSTLGRGFQLMLTSRPENLSRTCLALRGFLGRPRRWVAEFLRNSLGARGCAISTPIGLVECVGHGDIHRLLYGMS